MSPTRAWQFTTLQEWLGDEFNSFNQRFCKSILRMDVTYRVLCFDSHCHEIFMKCFWNKFAALSIWMDCTWCLIWMICEINFAKSWFRFDSRHTCDHFEEASMSTMKYLNGPDRGCIGPHMSPYIRARNIGISSFTLHMDGLVINFPVAHAWHMKSSWFRNFFTLILCPCELLIIFLIIPRHGWPILSCQRENNSEFLNIVLRVMNIADVRILV